MKKIGLTIGIVFYPLRGPGYGVFVTGSIKTKYSLKFKPEVIINEQHEK